MQILEYFLKFLFSYSAGHDGEQVRRNGARSGRVWNAQLFRRPRDAARRARLLHAAHDNLRRVGQHVLVRHKRAPAQLAPPPEIGDALHGGA